MASLKGKSTESAFGAFSKAGDLQKRILFTLIALVVFRFGTFVPLPGINPDVLKEIFTPSAAGGFLGMLDTFAGGALSRMTLLALNIMPYISASIIIQLGAAIVPSLIALKKEGESGHRKMNQYTRYLTVLITVLQGYGLAVAIEHMTSASGASAVIMSSPWLFRLTTVVSLLGGTMFVVWLGEQITARGVGNGTSLIITAGIIAEIPSAFARTFELSRVGTLSPMIVAGVLVMIVALIYIVVFIERAQRRIVIQYPKRQQGMRINTGANSYFPLKINPTGVMPPIFASALLMLVISGVQFFANKNMAWAESAQAWMNRGSVGYMIIYGALIAFFTFFYTGIVFNPTETADNLKKHGGFIAGIRPGKSTAEYLDYVVTRLTVFGAAYLTTLCVIPEVLISEMSIPFFLGGTTLLIVVTVIMDTMMQIQSHLVAYQYEGLIRKAQLKGRL